MPEMKKILGERGSGKTTELLKYAAEHGFIVVEPTYRMTVYASQMAAEKGIKANVVSIDTFLRKRLFYGKDFKSLEDCKQYVFDELDACLQQMGVVGYSNTIVLELDADIHQKSMEDAKTLDGMKGRDVNPWAVEKGGIEYGQDRCECCGMKLLRKYSSTVQIQEKENEMDFMLCDRCVQDLKAFIMGKKTGAFRHPRRKGVISWPRRREHS